MISIRNATPRPPARTRRQHGSGLAPLAAVHAELTSENARLKRQNAALKVALARAVLEKTRRGK